MNIKSNDAMMPEMRNNLFIIMFLFFLFVVELLERSNVSKFLLLPSILLPKKNSLEVFFGQKLTCYVKVNAAVMLNDDLHQLLASGIT